MSTVSTYADGYGNWHAMVPRDRGQHSMRERMNERAVARAEAEQAITKELQERGAMGAGYSPRVVLAEILPRHYHFREV